MARPGYGGGWARRLFRHGPRSLSRCLADRQESSAAARRNLSRGGIACLAGLRNVQSLHITGVPLDDELLPPLAALPKLKEIYLAGTQITDAGLRNLARATQLKTLALSLRVGGFESPSLTCQVTDAGLAHLSGLKGLEELHIDGTQITDAGLAHLRRADRHADSLSQRHLRQRRGTSSICRLTAPRGLYLNQTLVTNAALEILRPLPRWKLGLANTAVTDDALPLIASRTELIWLMLSDTAITDEGLSQLNGLPKLRRPVSQPHSALRQPPARASQVDRRSVAERNAGDR